MLLIRFMIYVRFSRFSVCSIVFFPVFLKFRDVQHLLILTADFPNYLLICLTRLRLSFLELSCKQVLPFVPEFHIPLCECHTNVTAEL